MDAKLIEQLNKVPEVFGFSGRGHERLFGRNTPPQKPSKAKADQGRTRRRIEELREQREIEREFDYL